MHPDNTLTRNAQSKHGRRGGANAGKSIIAQLRSRLEQVHHKQEELSEAHEQLLVDRESFNSATHKTYKQRVRTGDAEVVFMNVLRNFITASDLPFPPEITRAYQSVEEERNKLGALEEDHLQLSRDLSASEWTFKEMEDDLVQFDLPELFSEEYFDILEYSVQDENNKKESTKQNVSNRKLGGPDIVNIQPSTMAQYQVDTANLDSLMNQFHSIRMDLAEQFDITTQEPIPATQSHEPLDSNEYHDLLAQISGFEVRIRKHKNNLSHLESLPTSKLRRHSEPMRSYKSPLETPLPMKSSAISETVVPKRESGSFESIGIQEWLFNCLNQSCIEQINYLNILEQEIGGQELSHLNWKHLASQYWMIDGSIKCPDSKVTAHGASEMAETKQTEDRARIHENYGVETVSMHAVYEERDDSRPTMTDLLPDLINGITPQSNLEKIPKPLKNAIDNSTATTKFAISEDRSSALTWSLQDSLVPQSQSVPPSCDAEQSIYAEQRSDNLSVSGSPSKDTFVETQSGRTTRADSKIHEVDMLSLYKN